LLLSTDLNDKIITDDDIDDDDEDDIFQDPLVEPFLMPAPPPDPQRIRLKSPPPVGGRRKIAHHLRSVARHIQQRLGPSRHGGDKETAMGVKM